MRRRIFLYCFLMGVLVLLICGVLFYSLQYAQTVEEVYEALEAEAVLARRGLETAGENYLRGLDFADRVTWIGADGAVLFDSAGTESPRSQREAPEVREALTRGTGRGIRGADVTGVSTMYLALRCADGTVLRLGRPMRLVRYAALAVSPLLWVFLLVLLFSGVVAFRVAKLILKPINALDLDSPEPDLPYPELKPLVRRLSEQRETIRREAEEREGLRKEFSANVSHELKTPLTSISGFAELMKDGLTPPEKTREFAGDIYRESQRLIALVDDIMRLSKLDEESGFPAPEETDLFAVAGEAVAALRPQAEKRRVRLLLSGGPAAVRGVPTVLHELAYNLVDNAIKYNKEGGTVAVRVYQEGGRPTLSVEDTGIGIPPQEQERVFERFYRVDKSHSKTLGGTGLGLSIVKHAARLHNAELSLESVPGEGTAVTVSFPAL